MIITDLHNGFFRLTAPGGVRYIRTGYVYSEVICAGKNVRLYSAVS